LTQTKEQIARTESSTVPRNKMLVHQEQFLGVAKQR